MSLPIFRAAGATYAFAFGNFWNILRVVWLPGLASLGVFFWQTHDLSEFVRHFAEIDPHSDPDAMSKALGLIAELFGWMLVAQLVALAISTIAAAGLLKAILRGTWTKLPFYFQLGLDELRLLAATLIAVIVEISYLVVVYVIIIIASLLLATFLPELYRAVAPLVQFALIAAYFWVLLRLSLVAPNSIATERIGFVAGWDLTRGHVWHLLGFWLLVLGPALVLVVAIVLGQAIAVQLPVFSHHFPNRLSVPQSVHDFVVMMAPFIVPIMLGFQGISFVLQCTGSGIAYRQLTEGGAASAG